MSCVSVATEYVCETGAAFIKFICLDENSSPTIPVTMFWQLSDSVGRVIDELSFDNNDITGTQETITVNNVTGSGFIVVLSGDDLSLQTSYDSGERIFAIKGTYNSDEGLNLPLRGEFTFTIQDLINF